MVSPESWTDVALGRAKCWTFVDGATRPRAPETRGLWIVSRASGRPTKWHSKNLQPSLPSGCPVAGRWGPATAPIGRRWDFEKRCGARAQRLMQTDVCPWRDPSPVTLLGITPTLARNPPCHMLGTSPADPPVPSPACSQSLSQFHFQGSRSRSHRGPAARSSPQTLCVGARPCLPSQPSCSLGCVYVPLALRLASRIGFGTARPSHGQLSI